MKTLLFEQPNRVSRTLELIPTQQLVKPLRLQLPLEPLVLASFKPPVVEGLLASQLKVVSLQPKLHAVPLVARHSHNEVGRRLTLGRTTLNGLPVSPSKGLRGKVRTQTSTDTVLNTSLVNVSSEVPRVISASA